MGSLDPTAALPPFPQLKSFSLTHILYDPSHPNYLSIPLTLLSLSPIFLFVSYLTLLVFNRRLTLLILAVGSITNELISWGLKRIWKGERPYVGFGEVGEGYGMPSSHSQAAGFLVAWGIGYAMTLSKRYTTTPSGNGSIRSIRIGVYTFGLLLWSILTAYSRHYLLYHSPIQIFAGYAVGLVIGAGQFVLTEYLPLYYPSSPFGRCRRTLEWVWEGVGGIGGWDLGGAQGGWGEGRFFGESQISQSGKKKQ